MSETNSVERRVRQLPAELREEASKSVCHVSMCSASLLRDAADEIERLRAALADSCEEHRAEIYDTTTGGGCMLLHDAVAAERELIARRFESLIGSPTYLSHRQCAAIARVGEAAMKSWPMGVA